MTTEVQIGACVFRLSASADAGRWMSHAVLADTSERFGVECTGATEAEAIDRLLRWLRWQHDHTEALRVLQEREREYYRTVAASAFAVPSDDLLIVAQRNASLDQVDAARRRLDEVRASRPGE